MKASLFGPGPKIALTVAVSAVFAYLFLRDLDLAEVADSLANADYELVPLALLLFAASLLARVFRWQVFYQPDPPRFRLLSLVLLMTYAGNNLLPLRGGEILRAQLLLDRGGVSRIRTLGAAVIERLFDLLILGVFVVAGRFVVDIGPEFLGTGLLFAGGSAIGLVIAALIVQRPALVQRLIALNWPIIRPAWRTRLQSMADSMVAGFAAVRSRRLFLAASSWTVVAWLLEFGMYWLVAEAFGINEGFLTIAFVGGAASLALSVPSAQGGVGPFQLVAKEALLKFGVATNVAGAYAVALHVLLVAPVSLVGLLIFLVVAPNKRYLLSKSVGE